MYPWGRESLWGRYDSGMPQVTSAPTGSFRASTMLTSDSHNAWTCYSKRHSRGVGVRASYDHYMALGGPFPLEPGFLFFFHKFILFIFICGCVVSSLLCAGFLQLWRVGATLRCSAWASHCSGFSCCGAWALGARASVVVAHGLSCSVACGILPDQGSNLCPLHWQADS